MLNGNEKIDQLKLTVTLRMPIDLAIKMDKAREDKFSRNAWIISVLDEKLNGSHSNINDKIEKVLLEIGEIKEMIK